MHHGTDSVKKRYKVLLLIAGIWFFAIIATFPELAAVWRKRKAVRQTFSSYTEALVGQKFEEAYGYQSPGFRERVTLASFVQYQHDVQTKLMSRKPPVSTRRPFKNRCWRLRLPNVPHRSGRPHRLLAALALSTGAIPDPIHWTRRSSSVCPFPKGVRR
jgi:hypothetical protein